MSLNLFIPFLIATAILLATPGPTILLVVSYALAQGRGMVLAVVGGVLLGDVLAMSANLLGLGVVMTASASLFTLMKWAGAAYIAWMGWRMIRSAGGRRPTWPRFPGNQKSPPSAKVRLSLC